MKPNEAARRDALSVLILAAEGDQDAARAAFPIVCDAVRAWHAARGRIPLERFLRITGRRAVDRYERDRHLAASHDLMKGGTAWARSVELAGELERFRSRLWPAWRHFTAPPPSCSRLYGHLYEAMQASARLRPEGLPAMPDTPRRIHDVVKAFSRETS